ncbi:flagellar FliJ family protein [Nocardioides sp. SR21]|uniref:flagellar FliJ family protein n=1 Tax=Nocardioides sp. SR21 TaxID=2919501 RepID=UPI001FAA170F|nr:flagellar FliJ family protein [Nocardioides sp. SR21]
MKRAGSNLRGLVRLRSVRERDSRIGLAAALAEERAVLDQIAELERQLAAVSTHATTDVASFQARQHHREALGDALVAARAGLESAQGLTLLARNRWIEDRSRLAAVESLVARRVAAALQERRRREDREQDEVGTDLWRRAQSEMEAS